MSFTHTITNAVQCDGAGVSRSLSYSGSAEVRVSESIAVSTDTPIYIAIDVSAVKSFYMVSDRAVTVETNSSSAPTNTISLVAGLPYIWHTSSYDTFKLTGDVTVMYITNASGGTAAIEIRCIQDSTP